MIQIFFKGKVSTRSEECTIAVECDNGEWKSLSSKVIDSKKEVLFVCLYFFILFLSGKDVLLKIGCILDT